MIDRIRLASIGLALATLILGSALPASGAATFDVLEERVYGHWRAVLYRNVNGGRVFCAVETDPIDAPMLRINRYRADGDTFLEIFDPAWNMMEGVVRFRFDVQVGMETIGVEFIGRSWGDSYTYDFLQVDIYEAVLQLLATGSRLTVFNSNGTSIASYSLTGSAAAINAYRQCTTT